MKLRYAGDVEVEHIKENGVTFFGPDGEIYVNRGIGKVLLPFRVDCPPEIACFRLRSARRQVGEAS